MVEFAVVAPLLFVLLFGTIEFGIILYDQAVITNASREGARYYSKYPSSGTAPTSSDVTTYVQTYVAARVISFAASPPTVGVTLTTASPYNTVQVTYSYQFLVFGGLLHLLNGSITNPLALTATTVMQAE